MKTRNEVRKITAKSTDPIQTKLNRYCGLQKNNKIVKGSGWLNFEGRNSSSMAISSATRYASVGRRQSNQSPNITSPQSCQGFYQGINSQRNQSIIDIRQMVRVGSDMLQNGPPTPVDNQTVQNTNFPAQRPQLVSRQRTNMQQTQQHMRRSQPQGLHNMGQIEMQLSANQMHVHEANTEARDMRNSLLRQFDIAKIKARKAFEQANRRPHSRQVSSGQEFNSHDFFSQTQGLLMGTDNSFKLHEPVNRTPTKKSNIKRKDAMSETDNCDISHLSRDESPSPHARIPLPNTYHETSRITQNSNEQHQTTLRVKEPDSGTLKNQISLKVNTYENSKLEDQEESVDKIIQSQESHRKSVFITSPNILHPDVTDPVIRALLYPDVVINGDLECINQEQFQHHPQPRTSTAPSIQQTSQLQMVSPFAYSKQATALSKKNFNQSVSNFQEVYSLDKRTREGRKRSAMRASSAIARQQNKDGTWETFHQTMGRVGRQVSKDLAEKEKFQHMARHTQGYGVNRKGILSDLEIEPDSAPLTKQEHEQAKLAQFLSTQKFKQSFKTYFNYNERPGTAEWMNKKDKERGDTMNPNQIEQQNIAQMNKDLEQGDLVEDEGPYYEENWTRFSPVALKPSIPKLMLPEGASMGRTSLDELQHDGSLKFGKLHYHKKVLLDSNGMVIPEEPKKLKHVKSEDFEQKRPISPEEEKLTDEFFKIPGKHLENFEKEMNKKGFQNCLIVQQVAKIKEIPRQQQPQASKKALMAIQAPEQKYATQKGKFMPRKVLEDVADKLSYLKFGSRLHTINKLKQAQKTMKEGYELTEQDQEYKAITQNIKMLKSNFNEEEVELKLRKQNTFQRKAKSKGISYDASLSSGSPGALVYGLYVQNKESKSYIHDRLATFLTGPIVIPKCKHFNRMRKGYLQEMINLCKPELPMSRGEIILDEGDQINYIYLVLDGQVFVENRYEQNILTAGDVFGLWQAKLRDVKTPRGSDYTYTCFSEQVLLLKIDIEQYRWLSDKEHIFQIKENVKAFTQMPAFKHWSSGKITNFCSNMKVKFYKKDDVVHVQSEEVNDLMLIRDGKLRIDMTVIFETNNYWPARNKPRIGSKEVIISPRSNSASEKAEDLTSNRTFKTDQLAVSNKKTVQCLHLDKFQFACSFEDLKKKRCYNYGNLYGDDDVKQTAVCFIDRDFICETMMRVDVEELERDMDANKAFPDESDIIQEVKQKRQQKINRADRLYKAGKLNTRQLKFRDLEPDCDITKPSQLLEKWETRFKKSKHDKDAIIKH